LRAGGGCLRQCFDFLFRGRGSRHSGAFANPKLITTLSEARSGKTKVPQHPLPTPPPHTHARTPQAWRRTLCARAPPSPGADRRQDSASSEWARATSSARARPTPAGCSTRRTCRNVGTHMWVQGQCSTNTSWGRGYEFGNGGRMVEEEDYVEWRCGGDVWAGRA
jgi:hypothetical protein